MSVEDLSAWERHLCAPVTGRKIICAFEVLAAMTSLTATFRRWGAERPLLIAEGTGTGPLPGPDDAEVAMMEPYPAATVTEQVRSRMSPASRLTPALVDAVQRYDPAGTAAWWLSPIAPNEPILGRPVLSGRPLSQSRLENKTVVDGMLEEIGAARSGAVLSAASYDSLMAATEQVLATTDAEQVVWAGDSRDGINGAGDYVRWIRHREHALSAADFFSRHCDQVRVSPYLEGVPCSIHGIVLPDGVVVLRPVELASLLQPDEGRFFFGGMGTSWDPPPADTAEMRALTRRFGEHLRAAYGYRGAFGLDGVLTVDGFRVTELNPRFSGGLSRLARAAVPANLELVQVNALLGRDVGKSAADIEEEALRLLDDRRFISVMGMSVHITATETTEVAVTAGPDRLEPATADEEVIGLVQLGPAQLGAFARFTVSDDLVHPGDRCAPYGVLLCEFADRRWGTGFGAMAVPPDVRARPSGG